jgi:hypothetical protein
MLCCPHAWAHRLPACLLILLHASSVCLSTLWRHFFPFFLPSAGQSVARIQHVSGVDFSYQPPPRNIVPYAASLKGQASARWGGWQQVGGRVGGTGWRARRWLVGEYVCIGLQMQGWELSCRNSMFK